ncbi:MAG: AAA family ATPase [Janthinobacterium lividum]
MTRRQDHSHDPYDDVLYMDPESPPRGKTDDKQHRNGHDHLAGASDALPMVWIADIEPRLDGLWLVDDLLPANGLALLYGHPGTAKTFLAIDIAGHIAAGWAWHGREVRQGLVIYVGAEGGAGLENRLVAFKRHHNVSTLPFVLVPVAIDLQDPAADTPRLVAAIRDAATRCGAPPVLVVVDTLSKTFGVGQENSDGMVSYVANCQRIATEFQCCVMPVHHRPKDSTNETPRGHGSLTAGVDTVLLIEAGPPKRLRVTKQKDGELAADMAFTLTSVALGTSKRDKLVTSAVVAMIDGPAPVVSKSGRKLTDPQALTLTALHRAIDEAGEYAPPGIPLAILKAGLVSRVVKITAWRDQTIATTGDRAQSQPQFSDEGDQSRAYMRRVFNKSRARLQTLGIVQVWEGFAWPTP